MIGWLKEIYYNYKRPAMYFRRPHFSARRLSDGKMFMPSTLPGWTDGDALAALFRAGEKHIDSYYFVGIRPVPGRWGELGFWEKTGEVWQFEIPNDGPILERPRLFELHVEGK